MNYVDPEDRHLLYVKTDIAYATIIYKKIKMDESIISETNKNNNESNDNHSQNNIKSHRVITIRAALFPVDKLWDHKNWNMTIGECTIRKRMNCLHPQLIFYTSWFCPFAQRTWITLEESNVKYKWIEVNHNYN